MTGPRSERRWPRLEHMTFAWFTSSMSLGGVANLLIARIIDLDALYRLGIALLFINIVYLITLFALQVVRFAATRASVRYTLTHPIECCFLPTPLLACATVINGLAMFAGQRPAEAIRVALCAAFWIYFAAGLTVSVVCYTSLFSMAEQNMHHMNPGWVLPVFPLMLCGSVAVAVVPTQSEQMGLAIAICGLTCQGLGFTLSCMMYAVLLLRLMTVGYPPPRARPGLFMCCGPPAFTIICLLGLADEMQRILPALPLPTLPESTYETLFITALAASVLLWAISAWFYLITVAAIARALIVRAERGQIHFILAWWAVIFPITGFASATHQIARALDSTPIRLVAQAMVVVLAVLFVGVAAAHVRAVIVRTIMVDGADEDRIIDTMQHRCGVEDLETQAVMHQHGGKQKEERSHAAAQYTNEEDGQSWPPTYPSTPAVSIYRLEHKPSHI